jgi:hypothetical protein
LKILITAALIIAVVAFLFWASGYILEAILGFIDRTIADYPDDDELVIKQLDLDE